MPRPRNATSAGRFVCEAPNAIATLGRQNGADGQHRESDTHDPTVSTARRRLCEHPAVAADAFSIREAVESDRLALARLIEAVAAEGTWIGTEPPVDIEKRAAAWKLDGTLVAVAADELVGEVRVEATWFGYGEARDDGRRAAGAAAVWAQRCSKRPPSGHASTGCTSSSSMCFPTTRLHSRSIASAGSSKRAAARGTYAARTASSGTSSSSAARSEWAAEAAAPYESCSFSARGEIDRPRVR